MSSSIAALTILCAAWMCAAARPAAAAPDLRADVEMLIRDSGAQKVGVAFHNLATGEEMLIAPDEEFHAASTMKVPVMLEVYRLAGAGKLSLDDRLPIHTDFKSLADGSPFTLSASDDADTDLYKRAGQTATVRELVERMITMSSNLATNLLVDRVGAKNVMALMRRMGAPDVRVLRGVMDDKAYERGMNNTTTARGLMVLLRRIAERKAVSPKASDEMVRILLGQEHNDGIPAGLPADWRAAHKTGWLTGTTHDAAIVYPPNRKPYILVVLTTGIQDEKRANRLIADISRAVHDHVAAP